MMKVKSFLAAALVVCASILSFADAPKYVFLFIGDGMALPQRMAAEEFSVKTGGKKLEINHLPYHAMTRTCSASSLITDSAAAATAIACGVKTRNGSLGVDMNGKPVESVAEVAKKSGRRVGIATSIVINHATPGGFYAHRSNRSLHYQIGLDLVNSGFDFFAGGYIYKAGDTNDVAYKGNIYDLAAKAGYKVIMEDKETFAALKNDGSKVLYSAHASGAIPVAINEHLENNKYSTLAEITEKGIELLDNPNGFFFMIEGGLIDLACHANDAATTLHDVIAFNEAVCKALEFQKKHPEDTLILVTGDHETGGMTLGFDATGYVLYPERLRHQKVSSDYLKADLNNAKAAAEKAGTPWTFEEAKAVLTKFYGFDFSTSDVGKSEMAMSAAEVKRLSDAFAAGTLDKVALAVFNNKAGIGWTSGAHTALPVLTTAIGEEADEFQGFIENTDLSNKLKKLYLDND